MKKNTYKITEFTYGFIVTRGPVRIALTSTEEAAKAAIAANRELYR